MKALKSISALIGLICALMLIVGCKDIQISTQINPDGSCERIIVVTGDSTAVASAVYPLPDSLSWSMEVEKDEEDDAIYIYTFKKSFRKVNDLNQELSTEGGEEFQIKIQVELRKRFRWFYTFLTYREIYKALSPFNAVPLREAFPEEEVKNPFDDEAGKEMNKRAEEWIFQNLFEEYINLLIEGAEELQDPAFPPAIVETEKDTLFTIFRKIVDEDEPEDVIGFVLETTAEVFQTEAVWRLQERIEGLSERVDRFFSFLGKIAEEDYHHTVTIPGLIVDTNAEDVQGNSVSWDEIDFSWIDMEMWVESRIANKWAVWVTAILLLVGVAAVILITLRR